MTPEVRKLLAGYASGTLSEQERSDLFQAALADQELFNALADEEGLRELLGDAEVRGELLAALEEPAKESGPPVRWKQSPLRVDQAIHNRAAKESGPVRWKWYGFAGLTAGICVVAVVLLSPRPEAPQQIAQVLKSEEDATATPAVRPPVEERARQTDRPVTPAKSRKRTAEAVPAKEAPAATAAPPPPPAPAVPPGAMAESLGLRATRLAKSAEAGYTVEQQDEAGEWRKTETLLAGRATRLVLRVPAAGTVSASDGEREIVRLEAAAGTPVFIRVPSDEGERWVTVTQAVSGYEARVRLRFEKP